MKRIIMPFVAALAALVLPSCFQQNVTITLNKDGSGTIVEETVFGAQMAAMLGGMEGLGGQGGEGKNPLKELISEDKAKERAGKLGEGVTFEKSEAIDADGKKGARVTYRFADINKLKYSDATEAMGKAMGDAAPQPGGDKPKEKKPTTFKYVDGVLTITTPDDADAAKKEGDKEENKDADPAAGPDMAQAEAMAKAMMSDMKVSFRMVFTPGIAETNATHVDGDIITLAEMDMGKVFETPGAFAKMKDAGNDSAKAMEALKDVKGVKVETKKEITVRLK